MSHNATMLSSFMETAKHYIRSHYSMPPQYIAEQVAEIIEDTELTAQWSCELDVVRTSIQRRKQTLLDILEQYELSHIVRNPKSNGMFIMLLLNEIEIKSLRQQYQIHLLHTGRLSLASLQLQDIPFFVAAIAKIKHQIIEKIK